MESLMRSMLGRDEEFVVDRLHSLMKNEEKVVSQKEEIDSLNTDLENIKEENHVLKNKLDTKRDIIDDMEFELENFEKKQKGLKDKMELNEKELIKKETDLVAFEQFVTKQVEEINILKDNNQSMIKQISENVLMEKQINIQNGVIKELKQRLTCKESELGVDLTKEVNELMIEVNNLQIENDKKMELLEQITKEREILKEDLQIESMKNEEMVKNAKKFEENPSLSKEITQWCQTSTIFVCDLCDNSFMTMQDLKDHRRVSHEDRYFACKKCEEIFESDQKLKKHSRKLHEQKSIKSKLLEVEARYFKQKHDLSSKLLVLKENEEKRQSFCMCQGVCKIRHKIYNWYKPESVEALKKFRSIIVEQFDVAPEPKSFKCQTCEQVFRSPEDVGRHSQKLHSIDFLQHCSSNPWGLTFLDIDQVEEPVPSAQN